MSSSSFDLSDGKLQDYGIDKLCDLLTNNSTIHSLDLSFNSLTDSDIKKLSQAFKSCSSLEYVNLKGNLLSTLSGLYMFKSLGDKCRMVDMGLLSLDSIYGDAKMRLQMFDNISPERSDELLKNDESQEGLKLIIKELIKEKHNFKLYSFIKHEEFVKRTIRKVKFLNYLDLHPDIHDVEVKSPVVITGLYRTGTTLLFNLMSASDTVRFPILWEIYYPTPPPKPDEYHTDSRIKKAAKEIDFWKKSGYVKSHIHDFNPLWGEECMFYLREDHYYTEYYLGQVYKKHGYINWYESQDISRVYNNCKLFLKFISYYYKPQTHWLLKAPYHIMNINALVETYSEDTKLVFCHRDPIEAVASAISLWCGVVGNEWHNYDPIPAASHMVQLFAKGWNDTMDLLERYKKQGKLHLVYHVYYKELIKDPMKMVNNIHKYFGLPLVKESKMKQWMEDNPKGKHGKHKYELEDYGICKNDIYKAFERYYKTFFPELLPQKSYL